MKKQEFKIERKDGEIRVFDKNNNEIYWESNGYWIKSKFDKNNNEIYWENSNGYWKKIKYDKNNKEVYYEDSNGNKWEEEPEQPKKEIISAENLDKCLEMLKK